VIGETIINIFIACLLLRSIFYILASVDEELDRVFDFEELDIKNEDT
jgi:hypothetical protein